MCDDYRMTGTLYGIGLGPGDPELLTLKAVRLLKEADVVLVPRGRKSGGSTARDIVIAALGDNLPFRELVFPMVRDDAILEAHWDEAAARTAEELDAGRLVVFVTLGDVSIYSTFSYLCRSLKKRGDYPVVRVPGISSIQLGAASLNRELTLGNTSLGVYPMPGNLIELEGALEEHETVVVMKIGERLEELRTFLRHRNLESSAGFIRRAGFPDEVIAQSLAELPAGSEGYLSLVIMKGRGHS